MRYVRKYFDTTDPLPRTIFAVVLLVRFAEVSLGLWKGFIRDWYTNRYHQDKKIELAPPSAAMKKVA
jgi:hypothetical protein